MHEALKSLCFITLDGMLGDRLPSTSGVDKVDIKGIRMDLPHIQRRILLQAFFQLSLAISLCLYEHKTIIISRLIPKNKLLFG
jgi:hypothetical protein